MNAGSFVTSVILAFWLFALACRSVIASGYTVTDLGEVPYGFGYGVFGVNERGQAVGNNGSAFLWVKGRLSRIEGGRAFGINNPGEIIGSYGSYNPVFMSGLEDKRAFLYRDSHVSELPGSEAYGINDRCEVVGIDAYRGFYWSSGKALTLRPLSHRSVGNGTRATAINNRGQFVGATTVDASDYNLPVHAFLWVGGKHTGHMKDLGTLPGFHHSLATALNERGQVVGYSSVRADSLGTIFWPPDQVREHALLWQHGRMLDLGTLPGGSSSAAYGINNITQIVGAATTQDGTDAFFWQKGKMYDLNELLPVGSGWILETANAINNQGQIVGDGLYMGRPHAFLLTPQSMQTTSRRK